MPRPQSFELVLGIMTAHQPGARRHRKRHHENDRAPLGALNRTFGRSFPSRGRPSLRLREPDRAGLGADNRSGAARRAQLQADVLKRPWKVRVEADGYRLVCESHASCQERSAVRAQQESRDRARPGFDAASGTLRWHTPLPSTSSTWYANTTIGSGVVTIASISASFKRSIG
jgi:hypothetical protein